MREDNYYIMALSNWMTLQPELENMSRQELFHIYILESKVRRRRQILDRIYKRLMRMYREELKAELEALEKQYGND